MASSASMYAFFTLLLALIPTAISVSSCRRFCCWLYQPMATATRVSNDRKNTMADRLVLSCKCLNFMRIPSLSPFPS
jgi:hypothetical protein